MSETAAGAAPPGERSGLDLALRWSVGGRWYSLHRHCGTGITALDGPGACALLALLAGYPVAHTGIAQLDGRSLRRGRAVARAGPNVRPVASVLPQDSLPLHRTPLRVVTTAVRMHGVLPWDARRRAAQALRLVSAGPPPPWPLGVLDASQRRRTELARALATVPGLLLLERPCAPLPVTEHERIYTLLRRLAGEWEMVVLLIPDLGYTGAPPVELEPE